ncbi:MAG: PaaI family thioesterase [Rhodoblastus sp.]|nr:PaaI family thioesterase [Rhodoblastus sp.]
MDGDASAPENLVTPIGRLLGRAFVGRDRATSVTRSRFVASPKFANRHGSTHGGMLAAMLDSAAVMAAFYELPPGMSMVTARLDVEFLKPAPIGQLEGSARIAARDERNIHVDAELATPAGVVVARARATLRLVPRRLDGT